MAWILWISSLVMGFSTLIIGTIAGDLFNPTAVTPEGEKKQSVGVLPIVTPGGPSDSIAQPKIKTFFELSLVPADYSTININPQK